LPGRQAWSIIPTDEVASIASLRYLKKFRELVDAESGFSEERSQSPFGELLMVGDCQAAMRRRHLTKNDVASSLPVESETELPERFHGIAPETTGSLVIRGLPLLLQ
jgi:hypothetical protein